MSAGVAQTVASSTGCAAALRACSGHASLWTLRVQSGRAPWCKSRRAYPNVRAVSAPEECNEGERAVEKEVGKVSTDRIAEEKTKVTGPYAPPARKWTGYVEKDTAGQNNIYSVEPAVYISENAISTGSAGGSAEGSQLTVTVSASLALGLVIAAGVVLLRVGSSPSPEAAYDGPALSFYVQKFKPSAVVAEAKVPPQVTNPVEAAFSSSQPLDEEPQRLDDDQAAS